MRKTNEEKENKIESKKKKNNDSKKNVVKKTKTKKNSLFTEIKKEMEKVHFPSRKDMVKYSVATIVFVIFFALYFYAIELVMAFLKSLV